MSTFRKRGNFRTFLIIAAAMAVCVAIAMNNHHIANWKVASARLKDAFIIAGDAASIPSAIDLGIMSETLTGTAPLLEPLAHSPISSLAALRVKHERYYRSGKNSSWHRIGNTYDYASPVKIGNAVLDTALIEREGSELWQPFPLDNLQGSPLLQRYPHSAIVGNDLYLSGSTDNSINNERYIFTGIFAPQPITVIARASMSGSQLMLSASPLLPNDFPALWSGSKSVDDILAILHKRFTNTMMAIGSMIFLLGWLSMVLMNTLLYKGRTTPGFLLFAGALATAFTSLGLWYLIPVTAVVLSGVAVSFLVFFFLLRLAAVTVA